MNKPRGSAFAVDITFESNGYDVCSQIIALFHSKKCEVAFVKVETNDYKDAPSIEMVDDDPLEMRVQFTEEMTKAMDLGIYDVEIKARVGEDGVLTSIYQENNVFNIVYSHIK